jgi:hypothetical protein
MTEYQNMEMHAAVSRRGKMFQKKSQEKRGKKLAGTGNRPTTSLTLRPMAPNSVRLSYFLVRPLVFPVAAD